MDKPAEHRSPLPAWNKGSKGFTFLEIIIVISLIAFVYVIALPNFNFLTGNEVATRLGRLSEDIKSAYDYSILSGKTVRLVFRLESGDYWLESTDAKNVAIEKETLGKEALVQSEEQRLAEFNDTFQKYIDLAGEKIKDPSDDESELAVETPLIKAKDALQGPSWYRIDSLEWQNRNLGEYLVIGDFQAEHLEKPVSLEQEGREAEARLYFLPQGYVEKAIMHVYYRTSAGQADTSQSPYTIVIHPYEGHAEVKAGYEELDFNRETTD